MKPRLWTYGWIRLLGPSSPNVVLEPKPQGEAIFLDFIILLDLSRYSWEKEDLYVKIWAKVLNLWLDTSSGLKSDPNVVSRPQTPSSRNFLRFHNFIGFISWLLRKWGLVCENWNQGSGLMAEYVFMAQVAQM